MNIENNDSNQKEREAENDAIRKKVGESRIEPLSDEELEIENGFFTVGEDRELIEIDHGRKKKEEGDEHQKSAENDD